MPWRRRCAAGCVTPLVRFEGLAGEFSQHDFGEVEIRYQDGTTEHVHFFASRLEVLAVGGGDAGARPAGRNAGPHAGRPPGGVRGHPAGRGLRPPEDGRPEVGPRRRGDGVESHLCGRGARSGPRGRGLLAVSGPEKGAVENLVGWVKGSFFKQRRFLDREDLARQLGAWLVEANTVRPSRATGVPPATRIAEERARLRPLKIAPADLALRIPGQRRADGRGAPRRASVLDAPGRRSRAAQDALSVSRARRIVAGRFGAEHVRQWQPGADRFCPSTARSASPPCRANAPAAICSGSTCSTSGPRRCLLTELIPPPRRAWIDDVERLHDLLQTVRRRRAPGRLRSRAHRAGHRGRG